MKKILLMRQLNEAEEDVKFNLDLLWIVLLILLTLNGPDGLDLLDVIINYIGSL